MMMGGDTRASIEVTRAEFEEATSELLERTVDFTRQTLEAAKERGVEQIDRVLLVGGSSFMPAVKRRLAEAFPGWAPELEDPNQAVAKGAALYGFQAELRELLERELAAAGNGDGDGATGEERREIERRVADRVGISTDGLQRFTETEVTPVCSRGFGIKVLREGVTEGNTPDDFFVDHLIKPNTPLPVPGIEETYQTVLDNQTSVEIALMEQAGTVLSERVEDNGVVEARPLQLSGRDPAGAPIHVRMELTTSGLLNVVARDASGRELVFDANVRGAILTPEQIEQAAAKVQAIRRM
jgi:molecular chaperone DnaK (HSP70)